MNDFGRIERLNRHPIEENVSLGDYKKRARITTIDFSALHKKLSTRKKHSGL